jgi:hypothetical protein
VVKLWWIRGELWCVAWCFFGAEDLSLFGNIFVEIFRVRLQTALGTQFPGEPPERILDNYYGPLLEAIPYFSGDEQWLLRTERSAEPECGRFGQVQEEVQHL